MDWCCSCSDTDAAPVDHGKKRAERNYDVSWARCSGYVPPEAGPAADPGQPRDNISRLDCEKCYKNKLNLLTFLVLIPQICFLPTGLIYKMGFHYMCLVQV